MIKHLIFCSPWNTFQEYFLNICGLVHFTPQQDIYSLPQDEQTPLIHRAIIYGELDTFTDLIEEKGIDPCLSDHVSISTVCVHHKPRLHILTWISLIWIGIWIKGWCYRLMLQLITVIVSFAAIYDHYLLSGRTQASTRCCCFRTAEYTKNPSGEIQSTT